MTRHEAKEQFSRRFNIVLDDNNECPRGRGRRSWVSKEFSVSVETARKWLTGLAIPDQTNMGIIAARLQISPAKLHAGVVEAQEKQVRIGADRFASKLAVMWDQLTDEVKGQIVAFALINASTLPASKKADPQGRGRRAKS